MMPGKANVGKAEYKKTKTRRAYHVNVDGKTRKILQNPAQARAAARAKTTKSLRQGYTGKRLEAADLQAADSLYNGVMGMAVRGNFGQEIYNKLAAMDPKKLLDMYDKNDLIFEVYFQYTGIHKEGSYWTDPQGAKDSDALFLIENYERLYGPL